jgi:hypothetical protein
MKSFKLLIVDILNIRLVSDLEILRPHDLAPRGIRSSYGQRYEFRETFEHIFTEANKPDPLWKLEQEKY